MLSSAIAWDRSAIDPWEGGHKLPMALDPDPQNVLPLGDEINLRYLPDVVAWVCSSLARESLCILVLLEK
jgi:hypothetical protein